MPNNEFVKLPLLSNKIYKEWRRKTVLVQSCDDSFEGEFSLEKREIDIPIYHDLSVHQTTIKERELKPAPIEFLKASTKRVSIDKGRYTHWGQTTLGKLINRLSDEESEVRKKLVTTWATEAENELASFCANLGAKQTIDLTAEGVLPGQVVNKDTILLALDILKAKVIKNNMDPAEFKLFASERFETVLRDTKISIDSLSNDETFRAGSVGIVNGVDVRKHQIPLLTTRNATTALVESEYAIWKTRDGIQYVVPYKNTISYDIQPTEILLGGKGYQTVEYYDFFNLYPTRLYKVELQYVNEEAATPGDDNSTGDD